MCINDVDILFELDKGEEKRKADYTIWGYLYQFDLMLYDMLNQNTTEDMFGDNMVDVDAEYEVEMVEDYAKSFIFDTKQYFRIAQIKYHSQSDEFKDKEAILLLYYAYLKYKSLNTNNSDFKCALFYYNKNEEVWSSERIREFLKNSIEDFMATNTAIEESATTQQSTPKRKTKKGNSLNARVKKIIGQSSNQDRINEFVDGVSKVKWTNERQALIELIKEKLIQKYPNDFNNYLTNKGDILYSLYIDYIINSWQKKKRRKERVKIRLSDIEIRVMQLINYEEETFYQSIINNIRDTTLQILNLIEENLESLGEIEAKQVVKKYELIAFVINENIKKYFSNKRYRFSFLNTITQDDFCEYSIYETYKVEKEYELFLINEKQILNFINRAMKFIYYYRDKNPGYKINFDDWFSITNEFWLFRNPDDKRNIILFPKPYSYPLSAHNRNLLRINKSNIRPEIWYFGKVKSKGIYDLEVLKPDESKQVIIDKPNVNKCYRIDCMNCLVEDEPDNFDKIESIFKEGCVEVDAGKNQGNTN